MKATEIKEPGFYWCRFEWGWEVIQIEQSFYDSRKLAAWKFKGEFELPLDKIDGEVFGPLKPPEFEYIDVIVGGVMIDGVMTGGTMKRIPGLLKQPP